MDSPPVTFRLPRTTYLIVLFLLLGALALAFGADASQDLNAKVTSGASNEVHVTWRIAFFLLPVLAAAYIARTATIVDAHGLRVRAVFGTRDLPWDAVRGLSLARHGVYAVVAQGSVRLPCVGVQQLGSLTRASGGRLPELTDPKPKFAPQRRRRR